MNKYDEELLKNSPSMIKGIAVEADKLNGGHHLSLTLDDVRGMTEFGLALGGQINQADRVSTEKLIFECVIGGALFGCLFAFVAANCANRLSTINIQVASKSRRDDPTTPRYAMSGFYNTIRAALWHAAVIDPCRPTCQRWDDMPAALPLA